jgi:phosphonate degradation associated HDIG domain protein
MVDNERAEKVGQILAVLVEGGTEAYFGESVTQLEHALQSAALAERDEASDTLVVAALLHDIGHLVAGGSEDIAEHGVDARHEDAGDRWLAEFFGPAVTEPIRLHVVAKRYLCAVEPGYAQSLSAASQISLALQGGAMTADEVRQFANAPWAADAARLRRWDDAAKVPGLSVPALSHYRGRLERLVEVR